MFIFKDAPSPLFKVLLNLSFPILAKNTIVVSCPTVLPFYAQFPVHYQHYVVGYFNLMIQFKYKNDRGMGILIEILFFYVGFLFMSKELKVSYFISNFCLVNSYVNLYIPCTCYMANFS